MTWSEVSETINACQRCPLGKTRKKPVIGNGNQKAQILFVAEAPGEQENMTGTAFVGPAGVVLDEELSFLGLSRSDIYLTNIVKCHPENNRAPTPLEQETCLPFLRHQFLLLHPRAMVLLGATACKRIIGQDFSILQNHGHVIERKNVFLCPTFHPSALLRDPSKKPLAKADLALFKELFQKTGLVSSK